MKIGAIYFNFGYDFIQYQLIFDNRTEIVWNQEIKDKINSWQSFSIN